jgi:GDP-L-fucose synthase
MHFIYDLARKIQRAKETVEPAVLWGDGHQRREVVALVDFCRGMLPTDGQGSRMGQDF